MKKLTFHITIDAPREKVWNTLWDDTTYRIWTVPFNPSSRAETDWQKGSKVLFLGDTDEGMLSTIADNIPNQFMSIKHLGVVNKGGIEDMTSAHAQQWHGAMENYTLKTVDGKTTLDVETDTTEEFYDYFQETWPKAMDKIKELSEQQN
ncbi:SRPBCC family protein [Chitinophaga defluvii]|uniref:SRPBCC domain-containing protein n=1 Tax=Chitinophaga defluvii TaxID=3163343 RepID=A0ABV2TAM6_9BACT